jgi:hypothetical protein
MAALGVVVELVHHRCLQRISIDISYELKKGAMSVHQNRLVSSPKERTVIVVIVKEPPYRKLEGIHYQTSPPLPARPGMGEELHSNPVASYRELSS